MTQQRSLTVEEIKISPPVSAEFVQFDNDAKDQPTKTCTPKPGGHVHCV